MFFFIFNISPIISIGILNELESVLTKMEEQTIRYECVMNGKPKMNLIEGGKKECSLPNEKCNKPESK
jgi:hypothetical protein